MKSERILAGVQRLSLSVQRATVQCSGNLDLGIFFSKYFSRARLCWQINCNVILNSVPYRDIREHFNLVALLVVHY